MSKLARHSTSRRAMLQAGTTALFGGLLAARPASTTAAPTASRRTNLSLGRAKNCILIYLLGGPPHLDMWDLKPHAAKEIRGPFQPIETTVPGLTIGEHLPQLSLQAERLAILRSLSYRNNDHPYMTYYTLTGRISRVPLGANTILPPNRSDDPHMGSVISHMLHQNPRVPGYVTIPEVRVRMKPAPIAGGGRAGFLGARFDPLAINDDPRKSMPLLDPPDEVSAERFRGRERLLAILDGRTPRSSRSGDYITTRDTAFQLTRAASGDGMLNLGSEPAALRDRYGRHRFGQSLLLSRRLVERGVSFVAVHFNYMSKCDGWDTHKKNFDCLQGELLPMIDQGISTLLDDLAGRGLLDETLIVTMGEFGRTPKINGNAGRDHWGQCGSVVFAGGGVIGGNIVGASDKIGALPTTHPVGPPDVVASIYHALGLDPHQVMYDQLNRPIPLSTGRVIEQLF